MKNPMEQPGQKNEDPQEAQEDEIIDFAKVYKLSSEELFAAYQIALGFPPEEIEGKQPLREEVYTLAKKMDELMKNGLAVNRISSIIDSKKIYEAPVQSYFSFVDTMAVTDEEKDILKYIVEKKKSGILSITFEQLDDVMEVSVSKGARSKEDLAFELLNVLISCKGQEIKINFTEE